MTREERLSQLVAELGSDPRYATGERGFPETISPDDAAEIADAIVAEVDVGVAARERAAVDTEIACRRGCNACCEELVMAWAPEALAVARYLGAPDNAEARQRFVDAYPAWRDAVGDAPARIARAFAEGNVPLVLELHNQQWKRRIMCALNHDGDCLVYPVRPSKCRTAIAVGTNDHCYGDDPSGIPAARLAFPPLDSFVDRVRTLFQAVHAASGARPQSPWALCEAVYQLCGEDTPPVAAR